MGAELELKYLPTSMLTLDGILSVGNWVHTDDVTGTYIDYSTGSAVETDFDYYIDDLFVGNQPQTSLILGATVFPVKGMSLQVLYSMYANMYADWSPTSRVDDDGLDIDRSQSWKTPNFNLLNIHFNYTLPINLGGTTFTLFAHIFNALDATFIQDARDHSQYNAVKKDINGIETPLHSAQRAEVFFGLPRSYNAGISIAFN